MIRLSSNRKLGGTTFLFFIILLISCNTQQEIAKDTLPNIILIMTDDQGWGDTGYNGNTLLQTPNLDAMAAEGIQFNRFYAAAPVCSPTRASCLTGRHPYRQGIYHANTGHLKKEEMHLAKALKTKGYTTGHFGKWHLGTLTNDEIDANRGGRQPEHYAPPWDRDFDVCFSTESKIPTWDPMITPDSAAMDIGRRPPHEHFGTYFWTGPGQKVTDNLEGDASRIVMDRAIPFIENSVNNNTPFFAVVWFHAPHLPVLTGEKYKQIYAKESEDIQHYYGCITAMDEQVGRLRETLAELGAADNTMLFFTSDNGPEGKSKMARTQGSAKGLKGRKRSLYEGGIRVPGIWVWPDKIKKHQEVNFPVCTSDYFPTIIDAVDLQLENAVKPIDGISVKALLENGMNTRNQSIGFQSKKQQAWMDDRYKLYSADGENYELYDIQNDPAESQDLAKAKKEIVVKMKAALDEWIASAKKSDEGLDYN